jgi:hypothetical protein
MHREKLNTYKFRFSVPTTISSDTPKLQSKSLLFWIFSNILGCYLTTAFRKFYLFLSLCRRSRTKVLNNRTHFKLLASVAEPIYKSLARR